MNTSESPKRFITIQTMTREQVDTAVAWAGNEGWNPGKHDADAFYKTDPNGFLMALSDCEPVGCVSCVAYDSAFAFLGFYIVRPEYRGKGYGLQLWQAAMRYAGERNVGLDGVLAQEDTYVKSGFSRAYRNIRFEARERQPRASSSQIVTLDQVSFNTVLAYDARFFPVERRTFLTAWLAMPNAVGLGFVDGGTLRGYGVIRSCIVGHKIGPLFAESPQIADILYRALSARAGSGPIYLDVPEVNEAGVALAERYGMTKVFETARMYTKRPPALPLEGIFGVTSFELG